MTPLIRSSALSTGSTDDVNVTTTTTWKADRAMAQLAAADDSSMDASERLAVVAAHRGPAVRALPSVEDSDGDEHQRRRRVEQLQQVEQRQQELRARQDRLKQLQQSRAQQEQAVQSQLLRAEAQRAALAQWEEQDEPTAIRYGTSIDEENDDGSSPPLVVRDPGPAILVKEIPSHEQLAVRERLYQAQPPDSEAQSSSRRRAYRRQRSGSLNDVTKFVGQRREKEANESDSDSDSDSSNSDSDSDSSSSSSSDSGPRDTRTSKTRTSRAGKQTSSSKSTMDASSRRSRFRRQRSGSLNDVTKDKKSTSSQKTKATAMSKSTHHHHHHHHRTSAMDSSNKDKSNSTATTTTAKSKSTHRRASMDSSCKYNMNDNKDPSKGQRRPQKASKKPAKRKNSKGPTTADRRKLFSRQRSGSLNDIASSKLMEIVQDDKKAKSKSKDNKDKDKDKANHVIMPSSKLMEIVQDDRNAKSKTKGREKSSSSKSASKNGATAFQDDSSKSTDRRRQLQRQRSGSLNDVTKLVRAADDDVEKEEMADQSETKRPSRRKTTADMHRSHTTKSSKRRSHSLTSSSKRSSKDKDHDEEKDHRRRGGGKHHSKTNHNKKEPSQSRRNSLHTGKPATTFVDEPDPVTTLNFPPAPPLHAFDDEDATLVTMSTAVSAQQQPAPAPVKPHHGSVGQLGDCRDDDDDDKQVVVEQLLDHDDNDGGQTDKAKVDRRTTFGRQLSGSLNDIEKHLHGDDNSEGSLDDIFEDRSSRDNSHSNHKSNQIKKRSSAATNHRGSKSYHPRSIPLDDTAAKNNKSDQALLSLILDEKNKSAKPSSETKKAKDRRSQLHRQLSSSLSDLGKFGKKRGGKRPKGSMTKGKRENPVFDWKSFSPKEKETLIPKASTKMDLPLSQVDENGFAVFVKKAPVMKDSTGIVVTTEEQLSSPAGKPQAKASASSKKNSKTLPTSQLVTHQEEQAKTHTGHPPREESTSTAEPSDVSAGGLQVKLKLHSSSNELFSSNSYRSKSNVPPLRRRSAVGGSEFDDEEDQTGASNHEETTSPLVKKHQHLTHFFDEDHNNSFVDPDEEHELNELLSQHSASASSLLESTSNLEQQLKHSSSDSSLSQAEKSAGSEDSPHLPLKCSLKAEGKAENKLYKRGQCGEPLLKHTREECQALPIHARDQPISKPQHDAVLLKGGRDSVVNRDRDNDAISMEAVVPVADAKEEDARAKRIAEKVTSTYEGVRRLPPPDRRGELARNRSRSLSDLQMIAKGRVDGEDGLEENSEAREVEHPDRSRILPTRHLTRSSSLSDLKSRVNSNQIDPLRRAGPRYNWKESYDRRRASYDWMNNVSQNPKKEKRDDKADLFRFVKKQQMSVSEPLCEDWASESQTQFWTADSVAAHNRTVVPELGVSTSTKRISELSKRLEGLGKHVEDQLFAEPELHKSYRNAVVQHKDLHTYEDYKSSFIGSSIAGEHPDAGAHPSVTDSKAKSVGKINERMTASTTKGAHTTADIDKFLDWTSSASKQQGCLDPGEPSLTTGTKETKDLTCYKVLGENVMESIVSDGTSEQVDMSLDTKQNGRVKFHLRAADQTAAKLRRVLSTADLQHKKPAEGENSENGGGSNRGRDRIRGATNGQSRSQSDTRIGAKRGKQKGLTDFFEQREHLGLRERGARRIISGSVHGSRSVAEGSFRGSRSVVEGGKQKGLKNFLARENSGASKSGSSSVGDGSGRRSAVEGSTRDSRSALESSTRGGNSVVEGSTCGLRSAVEGSARGSEVSKQGPRILSERAMPDESGQDNANRGRGKGRPALQRQRSRSLTDVHKITTSNDWRQNARAKRLNAMKKSGTGDGDRRPPRVKSDQGSDKNERSSAILPRRVNSASNATDKLEASIASFASGATGASSDTLARSIHQGRRSKLGLNKNRERAMLSQSVKEQLEINATATQGAAQNRVRRQQEIVPQQLSAVGDIASKLLPHKFVANFPGEREENNGFPGKKAANIAGVNKSFGKRADGGDSSSFPSNNADSNTLGFNDSFVMATPKTATRHLSGVNTPMLDRLLGGTKLDNMLGDDAATFNDSFVSATPRTATRQLARAGSESDLEALLCKSSHDPPLDNDTATFNDSFVSATPKTARRHLSSVETPKLDRLLGNPRHDNDPMGDDTATFNDSFVSATPRTATHHLLKAETPKLERLLGNSRLDDDSLSGDGENDGAFSEAGVDATAGTRPLQSVVSGRGTDANLRGLLGDMHASFVSASTAPLNLPLRDMHASFVSASTAPLRFPSSGGHKTNPRRGRSPSGRRSTLTRQRSQSLTSMARKQPEFNWQKHSERVSQTTALKDRLSVSSHSDEGHSKKSTHHRKSTNRGAAAKREEGQKRRGRRNSLSDMAPSMDGSVGSHGEKKSSKAHLPSVPKNTEAWMSTYLKKLK